LRTKFSLAGAPPKHTNASELVSAIMPAYNAERFINQAIQSVLSQTYADWELIVVDDGSTDGTAAIVSRFTDPRIRCIHQENQGLAGARNTGIRAAQGTYLAFIDSDDEWLPTFLERCLARLQPDAHLAAVHTLNYHIDQNGVRLPQIGDGTVPPKALHARLLEGGFFPPCTVVVRTQVVLEVGLFDTDLQGQGTEDWDLWLRIARHYRMDGIDEPLVNYRVYPGSMATNAAKMHACRLSVLAKHFGRAEGDPGSWPEDKRRAYAFAHRAAALAYIAQGQADTGWQTLLQATEILPDLLARLDTFYELALGDQPRGYRGDARGLDISANAAALLRGLEMLFASACAPVHALRGVAFGNAHLALGMLADQAGDWAAARRYLLRAVASNPHLLRDLSALRRLAKVTVGRRSVALAKRVLEQE